MEYIKNIREALKDPKKKSLTQLGLWLMFFIFVSIILRSADSNDTPIIVEPKTPMEVYESVNGYIKKAAIITVLINNYFVEGFGTSLLLFALLFIVLGFVLLSSVGRPPTSLLDAV